MKDLDPNRSSENGNPLVGPIEVGEAPEWRRIDIPESGRVASEPVVAPQHVPERRIKVDQEISIAARFTTIDPVRDATSGGLFYDTSGEEVVLDMSRRGLCLRCERAPAVGTRLLLELNLPQERETADMVGRVCWTRVEYTQGQRGARAISLVGIQLLGGSPLGLDTYERTVGRLLKTAPATVATPEAVG